MGGTGQLNRTRFDVFSTRAVHLPTPGESVGRRSVAGLFQGPDSALQTGDWALNQRKEIRKSTSAATPHTHTHTNMNKATLASFKQSQSRWFHIIVSPTG